MNADFTDQFIVLENQSRQSVFICGEVLFWPIAICQLPTAASGFQKQTAIPCKIPIMAELKTIRLTEQVKAAG
jgi:hypothetical protein